MVGGSGWAWFRVGLARVWVWSLGWRKVGLVQDSGGCKVGLVWFW